jgi:DNA-binding beta-propeller fold protein YncE
MALELRGEVQLPAHQRAGGFDHGDVHFGSGRVYVAHTANGTVEVIDGERLEHLATIGDCAEASGVLCPMGIDLVFAAAREASHVLVILDPTGQALSKISVSGRPNGLASDSARQQLLVADVGGNTVELVAPTTERVVAVGHLPGRPRWAVYDEHSDRFLVNIREPAMVAVISPETAEVANVWNISSAGPHGIDLDPRQRLAFVACDGAEVVCLDSSNGKELATVAISGEPDAIWFNPLKSMLYVGIGDPGLVEVIDTQRMALTDSVSTELGAKTSAFDAARQRLYVFLPVACRAALYEESE